MMRKVYLIICVILVLGCLRERSILKENNNIGAEIEIFPFKFSFGLSKDSVLNIIYNYPCTHIVDYSSSTKNSYTTLDVNKCLIKEGAEVTYEFSFFFIENELSGVYVRFLGSGFDKGGGNRNIAFTGQVENIILRRTYATYCDNNDSSFLLNIYKSTKSEVYILKLYSKKLNQFFIDEVSYFNKANTDTVFFNLKPFVGNGQN